MDLIDTHCHLTFPQLSCDIDAVIRRSIAAGITSWITVGTDIAESRNAVSLADRFENMYAAVGIHPHYAKDANSQSINDLTQLAKAKKVVAIGETGLDFHYNFSEKQQQKDLFIRHIEIARETNLPLIIHSREAFDETLQILQKHGKNLKKVVFHCFGGTAEQALLLCDQGYYISFTGVITFKNAQITRDAAKALPLNHLMLETDCPYMSPDPMRKQKINEPALMIHTARFIADLKNVNLDDLCQTVTAATKDFFALP